MVSHTEPSNRPNTCFRSSFWRGSRWGAVCVWLQGRRAAWWSPRIRSRCRRDDLVPATEKSARRTFPYSPWWCASLSKTHHLSPRSLSRSGWRDTWKCPGTLESILWNKALWVFVKCSASCWTQILRSTWTASRFQGLATPQMIRIAGESGRTHRRFGTSSSQICSELCFWPSPRWTV